MTQHAPAPRQNTPASSDDAGSLAMIAVVVAAGVCSLFVLSAFFDARLAIEAQSFSPTVVRLGSDVSDIGLSGYMFALSALVGLAAFWGRRWAADAAMAQALTLLSERALYIFTTLAVGGLAAQLIKHLVGRARPRLIDTFGAYHFDFLSMKNSLASFPSGHSTTAFSMAVALGLMAPRLRAPLLVLATLIALSRIVVGAHYASDIVAGGALGTVTALALAGVFADRGIAFVRHDGSVRRKGIGQILPSLVRRTSAV